MADKREEFRRTTLGPRFSEGSRQLWHALERQQMTIGDLERRLDMGHTGTVFRWLYGDSVPNLQALARIAKAFRIDMGLWGRRPRRTFVPPAARAGKAAA